MGWSLISIDVSYQPDFVRRALCAIWDPARTAPPQVYWWHEKYKPKKPKFYNRVHTGYEWNKYNQTHYDQDNPPPKVVQVRATVASMPQQPQGCVPAWLGVRRRGWPGVPTVQCCRQRE